MFRVVNLSTGETLVQSNRRVSVGVDVDNTNRVVVTATRENIGVYLRDPIRRRADIKPIRAGWGMQLRMEI